MQTASPEYLVDTVAVQQSLDARKDNPFQYLTGEFAVPGDATPAQFSVIAKQAIGTWIQVLDKRGWTLRSNVEVAGPYPATEPDGRLMVGFQAFRVRGTFATVPKPVRIYVPQGLVKQDAEHTLTLGEAVKRNELASMLAKFRIQRNTIRGLVQQRSPARIRST